MHIALLSYSFPPQTVGVRPYLFEVVRRGMVKRELVGSDCTHE